MKYLLLLPILCCFYTVCAAQTPNQFNVTPSQCVASEQGELCQLTVSLHYPQLANKEYCLKLDEESQGCWHKSELPLSMNISIIEPTSLTLSDKQGDFSVSVMLNIKYRNAGNLRRRVRNPWSVF